MSHQNKKKAFPEHVEKCLPKKEAHTDSVGGRSSLVRQKAASLVLCLLVESDMTGGGVATLRKQQQDSPELELCEGEGEAVIPFSQPHSRSQAWDWLQRERLCVEGIAACKDTHSLGTGRWNGVPSRFLPDFCL